MGVSVGAALGVGAPVGDRVGGDVHVPHVARHTSLKKSQLVDGNVQNSGSSTPLQMAGALDGATVAVGVSVGADEGTVVGASDGEVVGTPVGATDGAVVHGKHFAGQKRSSPPAQLSSTRQNLGSNAPLQPKHVSHFTGQSRRVIASEQLSDAQDTGSSVPLHCRLIVGTSVGASVGISVGASVGLLVGMSVGTSEGLRVGASLGDTVGGIVGTSEGIVEGASVGADDGTSVGVSVGATEGTSDGALVGVSVGASVGVSVDGCAVGASVSHKRNPSGHVLVPRTNVEHTLLSSLQTPADPVAHAVHSSSPTVNPHRRYDGGHNLNTAHKARREQLSTFGTQHRIYTREFP